MVEFVNVNILDILDNKEIENAYFKKLKANRNEYKEKMNLKVSNLITQKQEYLQKLVIAEEELEQLHKEIDNTIDKVEENALKVSMLKKQVGNLAKRKSELQTDILNFKEKRNALSLEIVDLQEEHDEKITNLKKNWNAIKKACSIYKEYLDIHIALEPIDNDIYRAKVTFFIKENPQKDNYYVNLLHVNNRLQVESIVPMLKEDDKAKLIDLSKYSEKVHVMIFLSQLREKFLEIKAQPDEKYDSRQIN